MYCSKCRAHNEAGAKFCFDCGVKLDTSKVESIVVNNSVNVSSHIPKTPTKQICLVCKGKAKIIIKSHLIIGLILGLIVFPIIALATGGVSLIASAIVIFWGVSKKACRTCKGSGHLTM